MKQNQINFGEGADDVLIQRRECNLMSSSAYGDDNNIAHPIKNIDYLNNLHFEKGVSLITP